MTRATAMRHPGNKRYSGTNVGGVSAVDWSGATATWPPAVGTPPDAPDAPDTSATPSTPCMETATGSGEKRVVTTGGGRGERLSVGASQY